MPQISKFREYRFLLLSTFFNIWSHSIFLLFHIAVLYSLNLSWNCDADFIVVHILFSAHKKVSHFDVRTMVSISLDNWLL